jgi:SagB-type dehydrogenase family enzyme
MSKAESTNLSDNTLAEVQRYHERTKHAFDQYARGPETIDWSAQPNPFRCYEGAARVELPMPETESLIRYNDLYKKSGITSAEFNLESISRLLRLSLGLSAWKEYAGSRWSLRCNPSSGNLHPTEAYLFALNTPELANGTFHYDCYEHALEQRGLFVDIPTTINTDQPVLLMALTSVTWREAWKYGERAYRYCQLDVGHALAAIRYAAALLGWEIDLLIEWSDNDIANLTGIDRAQDFTGAETEIPECLLCIKPNVATTPHLAEDPDALLALTASCDWAGQANVLDPKHFYSWPIIDEVIQATAKPRLAQQQPAQLKFPAPVPSDSSHTAQLIIERRRSAQAYDGQTAIDKQQFFRMLDMLLPRPDTPPWDCMHWQAATHLLLFVHRVHGLKPGLYMLVRRAGAVDELKQALLPDKFDWRNVEDCPEHIPLYHLLDANCQKASATLSCHQRIASDGVFTASMLAEFDDTLAEGAWRYRQLYWEAGSIGQVLYLEAEAIDLQGTGIGCYFDDAVHEMLGLKGSRMQVMYHFTFGGAYNDPRLRTLAPYSHLQRNK